MRGWADTWSPEPGFLYPGLGDVRCTWSAHGPGLAPVARDVLLGGLTLVGVPICHDEAVQAQHLQVA